MSRSNPSHLASDKVFSNASRKFATNDGSAFGSTKESFSPASRRAPRSITSGERHVAELHRFPVANHVINLDRGERLRAVVGVAANAAMLQGPFISGPRKELSAGVLLDPRQGADMILVGMIAACGRRSLDHPDCR